MTAQDVGQECVNVRTDFPAIVELPAVQVRLVVQLVLGGAPLARVLHVDRQLRELVGHLRRVQKALAEMRKFTRAARGGGTRQAVKKLARMSPCRG